MLNGLADFIFGSRTNDGIIASDDEKNPAGPEPLGDDEWILINVKDTRSLQDEIKSRSASSRSSPVIVADPEIGVMEASTFGNFIGENHTDGGYDDSDCESLPDHRPANHRVQRALVANQRRAVTELVHGNAKNIEAGLRVQQASETEAMTRDLTQGKMKRASLAFDVKATKKAKQRKTRVKNSSGRNNDRKCQ